MADCAEQQPLHEYLRAHARNHPEKSAYQWYGRSVTWAEIDAGSEAFAARLQALGVAKGEPVVLFMNNCPQYVMAHYGIQKIGAIVCPCGPLNKEHELAYQLGDLQARVIVSAAGLLPVVDKVRATTALSHVFVVHYADLLPAVATLALPAELAQLSPEALRTLHASGALDAYARHPSQLYQAALEGLVLFVVLWWASRKPRGRYLVSGLFALLYGVFRFAMEFVRMPDNGVYLAWGWFTKGQLLSIPLIVLGVYLVWRSRHAPVLQPVISTDKGTP